MGKDSYALATGVFMAVLISAAVAAVYWLGDLQPLTRTYVAETRDSVTGLRVGSVVYYRGIPVGKVSTIGFDPDRPGVIRVPMAIDGKVRFHRDVYATLELQGVTGLTRIALNDGGREQSEEFWDRNEPIPIRPSLIDRLSVSGEDTVNEAHELMLSLNALLNETNRRRVETILANVEAASDGLVSLRDNAERALAEVPLLAADTRRMMNEVNGLTSEFKALSRQTRRDLQTLTRQAGVFIETGTRATGMLTETTLPLSHHLMQQLQGTLRRVDSVALMLESDPQAFLLGSEPLSLGPGEPGYQEP